MKRPKQRNITVHRDTGTKFVQIRDELDMTSDELLNVLLECSRVKLFFIKILSKGFKWI